MGDEGGPPVFGPRNKRKGPALGRPFSHWFGAGDWPAGA
jgi:hypothetical protein